MAQKFSHTAWVSIKPGDAQPSIIWAPKEEDMPARSMLASRGAIRGDPEHGCCGQDGPRAVEGLRAAAFGYACNRESRLAR